MPGNVIANVLYSEILEAVPKVKEYESPSIEYKEKIKLEQEISSLIKGPGEIMRDLKDILSKYGKEDILEKCETALAVKITRRLSDANKTREAIAYYQTIGDVKEVIAPFGAFDRTYFARLPEEHKKKIAYEYNKKFIVSATRFAIALKKHTTHASETGLDVDMWAIELMAQAAEEIILHNLGKKYPYPKELMAINNRIRKVTEIMEAYEMNGIDDETIWQLNETADEILSVKKPKKKK